MALKSLSTAELMKELERRRKNAAKLESRRATLLAELDQVEAELALLGEAPAPRPARGKTSGRTAAGTPRKRARNEINLPDAIAQAMEVGAQVTPNEAADLVLANGFQTTSARFNMMVSNALSKDKRFKRLSRGLYERIA